MPKKGKHTVYKFSTQKKLTFKNPAYSKFYPRKICWIIGVRHALQTWVYFTKKKICSILFTLKSLIGDQQRIIIIGRTSTLSYEGLTGIGTGLLPQHLENYTKHKKKQPSDIGHRQYRTTVQETRETNDKNHMTGLAFQTSALRGEH